MEINVFVFILLISSAMTQTTPPNDTEDVTFSGDVITSSLTENTATTTTISATSSTVPRNCDANCCRCHSAVQANITASAWAEKYEKKFSLALEKLFPNYINVIAGPIEGNITLLFTSHNDTGNGMAETYLCADESEKLNNLASQYKLNFTCDMVQNGDVTLRLVTSEWAVLIAILAVTLLGFVFFLFRAFSAKCRDTKKSPNPEAPELNGTDNPALEYSESTKMSSSAPTGGEAETDFNKDDEEKYNNGIEPYVNDETEDTKL